LNPYLLRALHGLPLSFLSTATLNYPFLVKTISMHFHPRFLTLKSLYCTFTHPKLFLSAQLIDCRYSIASVQNLIFRGLVWTQGPSRSSHSELVHSFKHKFSFFNFKDSSRANFPLENDACLPRLSITFLTPISLGYCKHHMTHFFHL